MSDKEHEELLAIYKIAIEDIRDSKHQQWRIVELTLLAIAALVYVHRYFPSTIAIVSLRFNVCFVGIIGGIFICSLAYSLSRYEKKKKTIRDKFSETVRGIEEHKYGGRSFILIRKGLQRTPVFTSVFIFFIIVALYIALSIIK